VKLLLLKVAKSRSYENQKMVPQFQPVPIRPGLVGFEQGDNYGEEAEQNESIIATTKRIVVDPVTRIEGHLHIEVEVTHGKVSNAWSTGTLFRGVEMILKGRNPEDAWLFTQRVCGVCTYVHGVASVRSVEDALSLTVSGGDGTQLQQPQHRRPLQLAQGAPRGTGALNPD